MKYLLCSFFLPLLVYGEETSFPPAVEAAKESVVKIIIRDSLQNEGVSQGTGFLLEDPYNPGTTLLITNFHVISEIKGKKSIHLQTQTGRPLQFERIKHLAAYPDDLAVLEVKGGEGGSLKLGVIPNNEVYVLGFPEGEFRKIRGEGVEQKDENRVSFFIQSDKEFQGISGSPILNRQGGVFGIYTADSSSANHRTIAEGISAAALRKLLKTAELPLKKPENLIKKKIVDLEKPATEGDVRAQYQLGSFFISSRNYEEAYEWLIKAVKQGHEQAREKFADVILILEDLDVQDVNKEIKKFKKSLKRARRGNAKSQYYVGQVFLQGLSIYSSFAYKPKEHIDHKKARKWFKKAAEQGHTLAQCRLGIMFFKGQGGEIDYKEARKWLTMAAESNNPEAQYELGVRLLEEKPGGWEKNTEEAIKWLERAADQGDAIREAEMKADGILFGDLEGNYEDEKEFFRLGQAYHVRSQHKLGTLFFEGLKGIEPDYQKARKWFMRTMAQAGKDAALVYYRESAQYHLGIMSFKGLGLKMPDYQDAFEKFFSVANTDKEEMFSIRKGHAESQYMLGTMFFKGLGVKPDREEAYKWFLAAARQGHIKARRVLNRLFQEEEAKRGRLTLFNKGRYQAGKKSSEERCYKAIAKGKNDLDVSSK